MRNASGGIDIVRASAALGACIALAYAVWEMWTAFALSGSAPLAWRSQLLLLEGGPPLLFAAGCGCAAWGRPRLRRLGWGLVVLTILGLVLWSFLAVPPHRLAIGAVVGGHVLDLPAFAVVLDEASRLQIVEAAYRQYSDPLISYADSLSARSDADVAEEAVHDVFAALLAGQRDDAVERDPDGFKAHLFSAVKQRVDTVCRSERRRAHNTHRISVVVPPPSPIPTPADQYTQTELEQRLRAELKHCSARAVEAFHLVHECGLSYAEAASVMGITTQAVGSHLNRILRHLRGKLSDWAPNRDTATDRTITDEVAS